MAMFFPMIPEAILAQAAAEIGRVPAFDMEARRFLLVDGKLVERTGQEAVRQWFELALRQQPDRVPIYRTSGEKRYGIDRGVLETKLPSGYAEAELERSVRETASFCPAVRAVRDLAISRQGRACLVEFTAVLHTGETVEVSVDV